MSLKDVINSKTYTVHQMLTLASMAELEGKSDTDRAKIVGVFFNRLNANMSLGSDVTTYYAFKRTHLTDRSICTKIRAERLLFFNVIYTGEDRRKDKL